MNPFSKMFDPLQVLAVYVDFLSYGVFHYLTLCCRFDGSVLYKSYTQNLTIPADQEEAIQTADQGAIGKAPPPPGSNLEQYRPPDKSVTTPSETEVAIQV